MCESNVCNSIEEQDQKTHGFAFFEEFEEMCFSEVKISATIKNELPTDIRQPSIKIL